MTHAASVSEFLQDGPHNGPRIAHGAVGDIIECFDCGFRHVLPLPELGELSCDETGTTHPLHASEDQPWFELAHNDRLEIFEKLLAPTRRRILDVGRDSALFLKTARARGWDGHSINGAFSVEIAKTLGQHDVVMLTGLLQHAPHPAATLELARSLMDAGGVLCVSVPNDFSPLQIAARGALGLGDWWLATDRLNYFDFDSLCALLERQDMKVVERTTVFPMEAFLMMGENYIDDGALGRACHNKRKRFDMALEAAGLKETRRELYRALARLGIGREAVVIARKS
ncbi:MAG TPA: methyltransferase domain-containing protein [Rhizomicrobium sp.]